MDTSFGADRKRWKASLFANLVRNELVDGDVAIRPVFRFVVQHPRQERVYREMSAPESVIETPINRYLLAVCRQRPEQGRFLKVVSRCLWEKLLLLKSKQITDRDKPSRTDTGCVGR
jgi:hypothetical protein